MRTAACPSCGGPLRFRGATSIVAVCGYCKSTLVREGVKLEDIGKQAELLEDHSPIRVGAAGKHRGRNFQVVGRIQYKYADGVWNEWHVVFDDGKSAWLSDASREYTMTYLAPPAFVPAFTELKPGDEVKIGQKSFSVGNVEAGEVVAGEGELPFKFQSGWKANVADLRGEKNEFATIDYSEDPPHVYVGEKLPFGAFAFSGLRDPEALGGFHKGKALAFKCPGCGAPVEKRLTTTEVVACGSCGTVSDVSKGVGELVQKNELNVAAFRPSIPVGATGKWNGIAWEIVGYMRRGIHVDGESYEWGEYLLHNVEEGYAWLSEYAGHFSFIRNAAETPKAAPALLAKPQVKYLDRVFTHFQKAKAAVTYLVGEFYWRVKLGDIALCDDYIAPPLILSSEKTGREITWSLGEYVEPAALWKAFKVDGKPPPRVGVAPNQPSPYVWRVGHFWKAFAVFAGLALAAQVAFKAMHSPWSSPGFKYEVTSGSSSRTVSPPFELQGAVGPVTVRSSSNASDTWLELDLTLTQVDTGAGPRLVRRFGYQRIDGQLDGSQNDVAEFPRLHPGKYTLTIEARAGPTAGQRAVSGQVELRRPGPGWSNFFFLAGFLLLWPLIAWGRKVAFEFKRWSESDYQLPGSAGDG